MIAYRVKCMLLSVCLGLTILGFGPRLFGQESGTLVISLKNYASDSKIPKRTKESLEHTGIRWGIVDDNVLISLVRENFVKAEMPYLTRFGEQKAIEMKAGPHSVTCIGIEFNSTSRDVDKYLAKSAFFNNDVLIFTVLPGKTTTLEIYPTYKAESQWWVLSKITMLIPELKVRVLEDGIPKGEDLVINQRTPKSVAWNDYKGPLKF